MTAPAYQPHVDALYARAAKESVSALCCTQVAPPSLPGLTIPQGMLDKNYGCGNVVRPHDLTRARRALYIGVGAGMEALQLAYFLREPGAVLAIDRLPEMLDTARALLAEAATSNPWFDERFVELKRGDALDLPVEDESVDVVAQNCLFNIFEPVDLARALREAHRVLAPHGRLLLSDPVADRPVPQQLADDPELRALCLSGALPLEDYLRTLTDAGFGTIEVRARRPYRALSARRYGLAQNLLLTSVEIAAIKDPMPDDGPCIYTGRTAIYVGDEPVFDDGKGHLMQRDIPVGVCDKTASALGALDRDDLVLTPSTWHYDGSGCC